MWPVKTSSGLIGGKFIFSKNPLQDLLSSLNAVISTNESTRFLTGHVIYNLAYTHKFQLKTPKLYMISLIPVTILQIFSLEKK